MSQKLDIHNTTLNKDKILRNRTLSDSGGAGILRNTDANIILKLYQTLYDTSKILKNNSIEWWAEGGTLLGAVRHKGIIPWDDDCDIQIDAENNQVLSNLSNEFDKNGYNLVNTWFGYKVCSKDGKEIEGFTWTYPSLDIFLMKKNKSKTEYEFYYEKAEKQFGPTHFKLSDLYPLRRYKFGEIDIMGAFDPSNYLNEYYGKDWNDIAYRQFDHSTEEKIQKHRVVLTNKDRVPAQPTGPIIRKHSPSPPITSPIYIDDVFPIIQQKIKHLNRL